MYKTDPTEPDYFDGVVSHPEPDILECEVRRAFRSTAVNRASGCDEIAAELFKSLKDGAIRVLHSFISANLEDPAVATGLEKVSPHPNSQEGVPKNVLTTGQLHSSPMLVRSCLKSCLLSFTVTRTKNFQMSKLGLEKDEEPEIKLPTFAGL